MELTERRVPPTPTPTTVPTAIPDDHSDEDRGATRIRAGQTLDGRFETRDDVDVFRFDARARVRCTRSACGTGRRMTRILICAIPTGRSVASDDDSGSGYEALIEWTALRRLAPTTSRSRRSAMTLGRTRVELVETNVRN